jgi:hypothetical protein
MKNKNSLCELCGEYIDQMSSAILATYLVTAFSFGLNFFNQSSLPLQLPPQLFLGGQIEHVFGCVELLVVFEYK